MNTHNFLIEICRQNKTGTGLYLIESGVAAYIFIVTGNPNEAIRFTERDFAEAFILKFPQDRQRFMKIVILKDIVQELKIAA